MLHTRIIFNLLFYFATPGSGPRLLLPLFRCCCFAAAPDVAPDRCTAVAVVVTVVSATNLEL